MYRYRIRYILWSAFAKPNLTFNTKPNLTFNAKPDLTFNAKPNLTFNAKPNLTPSISVCTMQRSL